MPTVTLGLGNSAAPNQWTSAPNGVLELIASTNDTNWAHDASNLTGTSSLDQGYAVNDTPSTFQSMNTLSVRLRYGWAGTFSNRTWGSLNARVMNGTQVLAGADAAGTFQTVASSVTNTTPVNSAAVSFSYVNTAATKANWDAAVLEMEIVSTRSGGGSSVQRRVYAGELVADYNEVIQATLVKSWDGSTWNSGYLRRWNGSAWVFVLAKRWNGTAWVDEYGRVL